MAKHHHQTRRILYSETRVHLTTLQVRILLRAVLCGLRGPIVVIRHGGSTQSSRPDFERCSAGANVTSPRKPSITNRLYIAVSGGRASPTDFAQTYVLGELISIAAVTSPRRSGTTTHLTDSCPPRRQGLNKRHCEFG